MFCVMYVHCPFLDSSWGAVMLCTRLRPGLQTVCLCSVVALQWGSPSRLNGLQVFHAPSPFTQPTHSARPRNPWPAPVQVLDAPSLQDDFYLNLVDWSASNVLAVGLGSSVYVAVTGVGEAGVMAAVGARPPLTLSHSVIFISHVLPPPPSAHRHRLLMCRYLWSACTSKVTRLVDLGPEDSVTSVSWTQRVRRPCAPAMTFVIAIAVAVAVAVAAVISPRY
jgi:hypothetical protein